MAVYTIAGHRPFAETLARGLIERLGDDPLALAGATVFLPTRRAVRTLGETFAKILGGAALLPQLRPLGDVDEDAFLFDPAGEDLSLPPALPPVRRRLLLAMLVRRWDEARSKGETPLNFAQAAQLACALGHFLDEVETQGGDLSRLEDLAPAALAEHWTDVRDFLVILREQWPGILAAEKALEPAARRNRLLAALAESYAHNPPAGPVIAAGTTGSIPATARLLAAIAHLPQGAIVLPGLDRELDEASWAALDPGHPQYGLKDLLARLGVARADVRDWGAAGASPRATLLSETLRPAPTTDAWRAIANRGAGALAQGLEGLSRVEAPHPGAEALAIALILRETLETKGATAALVTPDRNLARRVASELTRWAITIDDSAGQPLAHTAAGAFLLLLLEAVAEDFAPVPLLALLKHPLAAGGMAPSEFRRTARLLDRDALRGPRPDPGLAGIRRAIAGSRQALVLLPWFDALAERLRPLAEAFAADAADIAVLVAEHARAAEALAESDSETGAARLWTGDAGQAAAELFAALQTESEGLPAIEPASCEALIRTLMEERPVRPAYGRHPRLAILGPLEARLQRFDVMVLGGLNEGTWPGAVAADPWLSRPMRETLGLASPERAIGLAAHDFAMLAAGPRVFLTRALKADGSPTVASRWLQRLTQLSRGLKLTIDTAAFHRIAAEDLEQPDAYAPEKRPAPKPPVHLRPRTLSVTEIETWLRDPYAIYAKHVLGLRPLDPLDAATGPLERGTAIHTILELFMREWRGEWSAAEAEMRLCAIADDVFRDAGLAHATLALWQPRFRKAARWFVGLERTRRLSIRASHLEIRGTRTFEAPAGPFVLRGRADRIDTLAQGGAAIVDYKTGNPPTQTQVDRLIAPQLPLEGAILEAGGFAETGPLETRELVYLQFTGGAVAGKATSLRGVENLVAQVTERLIARIAAFDREETPYHPRLIPFRKDAAGDYDHLARVREWSAGGWQEDEE